MQTPPFRWDDLKVLLALLRARTLTGAGELLGVNASTVGRRVDALEAALEARLFERGPDGVVPTALGEELLPVAERLEQCAADVLGVLHGFELEPKGTVRVSAPPGMATVFIVPRLRRLRERYPGLDLHLEASVDTVDLTRQEAEIAVRTHRPGSGDLVALKLGASQSAVFVGAGSGWAAAVKDAGALEWITTGPELAHLPSARWVAAVAPAERIALRSNSLDVQVTAARGGLGAVVLPRIFDRLKGLREVKLSGALRQGLERDGEQSLWLVTHRALRDVPRVRAVWEFLIEQAREIVAGSG